jgi:transcriptional regulator with XRE-family HTH domain
LPFCKIRLKGARPREFPRGYPHELRTLGYHIRRRRLDLGLRQCDLAQIVGADTRTVANWELDRVLPVIRHYPAIILFLGYDPTPVGDCPSERLRALRRRLGLTQEDLAHRLGLDEGTVTEFEKGPRKNSRKVANIIAAVLNEAATVEPPDRSDLP